MKIKPTRLLSLLLLGAIALSCSASKSGRTCSYKPDSGKPNPLGMRAFITIAEKEGNTHFVFEQLPSNVAEKVTISSQREMIFYGKDLDTARVILLQNPNYYAELVGSEAPEGFAPVNEVLTCN